MHRSLDDELTALRSRLLTMADLVDEQLSDTVNALLLADTSLARRVTERDDELDALEMETDRLCERILALHHPVAGDLRMLIVAVKINTDLERMGDHCKNLAKVVPHLTPAPGLLTYTNIQDMADTARAMLRNVRDAFVKRDRLLARKVLAHDLHMDRLHKENFETLLTLCQAHPQHAEVIAHLITAGKALERISDHAKNIARDIVFLVEGVDIRHTRLRHAGETSSKPL